MSAADIVEGHWTPTAWTSYTCGSNVNSRQCFYAFDTVPNVDGRYQDVCEETSATAYPGVRVVTRCKVAMSATMVEITARINTSGQRVGCLAAATKHTKVDYASSTPGVSQSGIPVTVDVHDDLVRVFQPGWTRDGTYPAYTYAIDLTFKASCAPNAVFGGNTPSSGLVTVH